jgi:hypothetical protein
MKTLSWANSGEGLHSRPIRGPDHLHTVCLMPCTPYGLRIPARGVLSLASGFLPAIARFDRTDRVVVFSLPSIRCAVSGRHHNNASWGSKR